MGTQQVRSRYAELARAADRGASCCDASEHGAFGAGLYDAEEIAGLPAMAALASLGAATRWPSPTWRAARPFSTWAPGAASTCCCRPGASARAATSTGWT